MKLRRIPLYVGGVVVLWLIVLVILGFVFGERHGQNIANRMADALQGEGTVEDSDLALVRGRLELESLRVRRNDEVGRLELDVGRVRCELLPLGLALVDRDCRELAIAGLRLEVSTFAVFKVKRPKRRPIYAESVLFEDAELVLAEGASTSLGRVAIKLARVEAGPTTFKTPISWLFALKSFRATVEMSLGKVELSYENGVLNASGSVIGSTPLALAITLPVADPADDPPAELERIKAWGKDVIERIGKAQLNRVLGRP